MRPANCAPAASLMLALFVMFGRLSHRRAEVGWPTTTSRSLPASPSAGTVEADRT